jgi:hypothetical protein
MKLSLEKLQEINTAMLGLGAPIDIDGQGYNKIHFGMMEEFHYRTNLTTKQKIAMVNTMLRYSNTQLSRYKDDLKETLSSLESELNESATQQPKVEVVEYDAETVKITWKFNKQVSEFIKSSDRSNYKWERDDNGRWILKLYWDRCEEYIDEFVNAGFDTSEVAKAEAKSKEVLTV